MSNFIRICGVFLLGLSCLQSAAAEDDGQLTNPQPYMWGLDQALGNDESSNEDDSRNVVVVVKGRVSSKTTDTLTVPSNIGDMEISISQIQKAASGLEVEVGDQVTVYSRLESLCLTSGVLSAESIYLERVDARFSRE